MNSSDLWILCGRHVELCAFLHLSLGATIPLCTSSIGHFTWTNWVQVQSRRLSDVVWRLFLNGVRTRCSLPRCLSLQVAPVFIGQRYFPQWEVKCFSWAFPVSHNQKQAQSKVGYEPEMKGRDGDLLCDIVTMLMDCGTCESLTALWFISRGGVLLATDNSIDLEPTFCEQLFNCDWLKTD